MESEPDEKQYTLDELAALAGITRRTVRYYIQQGLIDRPQGVGRGAHYTAGHLEQLLTVRKWQQAGVALEKIRALQAPDTALAELAALAERPLPGTVEVRSHITVAEGLELVVSPGRAGLSSAQLRALAARLEGLVAEIRARDGGEKDS
jgi:DNA-binding transcriptional MerR regulator